MSIIFSCDSRRGSDQKVTSSFESMNELTFIHILKQFQRNDATRYDIRINGFYTEIGKFRPIDWAYDIYIRL